MYDKKLTSVSLIKMFNILKYKSLKKRFILVNFFKFNFFLKNLKKNFYFYWKLLNLNNYNSSGVYLNLNFFKKHFFKVKTTTKRVNTCVLSANGKFYNFLKMNKFFYKTTLISSKKGLNFILLNDTGFFLKKFNSNLIFFYKNDFYFQIWISLVVEFYKVWLFLILLKCDF